MKQNRNSSVFFKNTSLKFATNKQFCRRGRY